MIEGGRGLLIHRANGEQLRLDKEPAREDGWEENVGTQPRLQHKRFYIPRSSILLLGVALCLVPHHQCRPSSQSNRSRSDTQLSPCSESKR